MKILIIGGNSFIGQNLIKKIDKKENKIFIGNSNLSKKKPPINSEVINIHLNLLDKSAIFEAISKINPDTIINLASIRNNTSTYLNEMFDVNVTGINNIFKSCIELQIFPHFIFTSAMGVYNYHNPLYTPVDEDHPTNPIDEYGLTKLLGEKICKFYSENKFKTTILRIPGVYGQGKSSGFIYNLLNPANKNIFVSLSSKNIVRDFIYVDDVVKSIVLSITYKNPCLFNLFNVSDGKGISLEEIVEYANKITNKVFNISYSNLYSNYEFFMDNSKSQKELGFEPTNIYEGMEKFWKLLTRN